MNDCSNRIQLFAMFCFFIPVRKMLTIFVYYREQILQLLHNLVTMYKKQF